MFGNSSTLIASLIWGSIGTGFIVYGKKQGSGGPLFGGVALVAVSYFISDALLMSVVSIALIAGIIWWSKRN